jgi:uncharacterized protein YndB with AHSA1/START domain
MACNSESKTRQVGKLTVTTTAEGAEFRRVFDAPRRLVWEAMSKAEHYPKWWGMRSDTMVSCDLDFRAGGKWRFVTRGADGVDHAFRGEFREIVPEQRIVQTFEYEGYPGSIMLESLDLADDGDRTVLTATSRIEAGSAADVQAMVDAGMAEGAAETYDRLEELARELAKR